MKRKNRNRYSSDWKDIALSVKSAAGSANQTKEESLNFLVLNGQKEFLRCITLISRQKTIDQKI